jgi:Zn-dependent protease
LFPFIALGQVLHAALNKPPAGFVYPPNLWIDVVILMVILFVSVLWHELGHCFAARSVGGEANHILMWPLGGLAYVDIPNRPRPHFVTAAAGPLFDLLLCVVCALVLLFSSERMVVPPFNPLPDGFPYLQIDGKVTLTTWSGEPLTGLDPLTEPDGVDRSDILGELVLDAN